MRLSEQTVHDFIEILASCQPAPGGGSASALAGSVGAALVTMVGNLTVGKEKYREYEEEIKEVTVGAQRLAEDFLELIDKDTAAFNKVSAVFAMPKDTEEDKARRKEAMQEALKYATIVPFSMMEKSLEALKLCSRAVGKSNTNAVSDLGVGALNMKSALQGAWLNVLINLGSIKDEDFVAEYREKAENTLNEGIFLADVIYAEVERSLR